jgi:hypothetical protein
VAVAHNSGFAWRLWGRLSIRTAVLSQAQVAFQPDSAAGMTDAPVFEPVSSSGAHASQRGPGEKARRVTAMILKASVGSVSGSRGAQGQDSTASSAVVEGEVTLDGMARLAPSAPRPAVARLRNFLRAGARARHRGASLVGVVRQGPLRVRGLARGADAIGHLCSALGLVTCRPFDLPTPRQGTAGGYGWLIDEDARLDLECVRDDR